MGLPTLDDLYIGIYQLPMYKEKIRQLAKRNGGDVKI